MKIILTNVPISSFPNARSSVQMLFELPLSKMEMEDWMKVLSSLSKGNTITFELSSLAKHPFPGLCNICVKVGNSDQTCSNMGGALTTPKLSSITLKFISAREDRRTGEERNPSIADILRKNGWLIS